MLPNSHNRLELTVHVEHDGNYWVATCPAVGMTAAHQRMAVAWMRVIRMVSAQIVYALNHDPTLGGLLRPDFAHERDTLKGFFSKGEAFTLCLKKSGSELRVDIPDVLTGAV